MDFYTIKLNAQRACSRVEKDLTDARRVLSKTRSRLNDEKALLSRLEQQKNKLICLTDDSLAGDDNSYEKFKVSLKKLNLQIESTGEAVGTLEKTIIPNQKKAVESARDKLYSALNDFRREEKAIVEIDMNKLLAEIIQMQDSFITTFDKIYADYGFQFVINDRQILPLPKHDRLYKFLLVPRTTADRQAAMKSPETPCNDNAFFSSGDGGGAAVSPSVPSAGPIPARRTRGQDAAETPAVEQTQPGGDIDAPEAVLQAASQVEALNEPAGETPGTTSEASKTLLTGTV